MRRNRRSAARDARPPVQQPACPTRLVPGALSAERAWQRGGALRVYRRGASRPHRRRGQRRALVPRGGYARDCRGATARDRTRALWSDGGPTGTRRRSAWPRRGADAGATARRRLPFHCAPRALADAAVVARPAARRPLGAGRVRATDNTKLHCACWKLACIHNQCEGEHDPFVGEGRQPGGQSRRQRLPWLPSATQFTGRPV